MDAAEDVETESVRPVAVHIAPLIPASDLRDSRQQRSHVYRSCAWTGVPSLGPLDGRRLTSPSILHTKSHKAADHLSLHH